MAGAFGGADLPSTPSSLPADIEIAYVANDQVVAIGSSADFIKAVLDAGAGRVPRRRRSLPEPRWRASTPSTPA